MSRSRRKPWIKDHVPGGKRQANHKVRRTKDIANGKSYKKVYDSWSISDWKFYASDWKNGKAKRK